MHGLFGIDCTRVSLCGRTRPASVTCFMLHVAAYVVHCQLLGGDASWCSLFTLSGGKGHVDA